MLCPKCAREIPDSASHCPYCGERFAPASPPTAPPAPSRVSGLAIASLILALLFILILAAMVFPVFMRARGSRKAVCLSNVKYISLALQMYMADNDDRLPDADDWCGDLVEEYVQNYDVLICPAAKDLDWAYAYNSDLSGADLASFYHPPTTIAIFESDVGWNASGLPQNLLPAEPRHLGGDNFGYLDGHAQWLTRGTPLHSGRLAE